MSKAKKPGSGENFICEVVRKEAIEGILLQHGHRPVARLEVYDAPVISVLVPAGDENRAKFQKFEDASFPESSRGKLRKVKDKKLAQLEFHSQEADVPTGAHERIAFYEASDGLIKALVASALINRTQGAELKSTLSAELLKTPDTGRTRQ